MEKIRNPAVSGQFYEAEKSKLEERIKECFLEKRGPGKLPQIKDGRNKVKGIVVPHAGFIFSGAVAAHSYNFLCENSFAETFIIIGPNHTGMGDSVSIMSEGGWKTPLGTVPINSDIAKKLISDKIQKDESAHRYEHSIEVQLPFLQFCAKSLKFDFVPICMGIQNYETAVEVGETIERVIKSSDRTVTIIASSDFSHAGFNYASMPPAGTRVDKFAESQDKIAIGKICEMDPEGLIKAVGENNITMCGYGPVSTMLIASKLLGAKKAELLKYGTSYEVHPSSSCVGYGALAIY